MDKKRRDFLKVAGATTLAGLGGPAIVERLVSGSSPVQAKAAHGERLAGHGADTHAGAAGHGEETVKSGNRFGMIVDLRKFKQYPELIE
ncbi:MAG TPA: twin-arginine translocation signal domain-containing protein, partial [Desulfobulbus sp.]|nr:twin-arginine translocation signal domain-containing protein [Desulfobulbus sp.]